jgi:hypothetical protein
MRASSSAHTMRAGERAGACGASATLGRGGAGWRASALTCARWGEFGANTPRSPVAMQARGRDQRAQPLEQF